nr:HD domain-containing protein [bacterium]
MPVVFRDSLESLLITSSEYIDYDGLERIRKAYEFTVESNKRYDMLRFSGEPSIVHPLSVAEQLVKWRLDSDTIAAGILHDTIEDPEVHAVQLHATFGEAVTRMVDGVSKLKKFELPKKANPDTAFMWKIFLATASDIRVALIKIADRLHNMRTLESMPGYKTIKNCIETEKIFIPLAERLGMEALVEEMQDICFQYLHPNEYSNLIEYIDNIIDSESEILESSIEKLRPSLSALNIEYQIKPFYYSHSHINRIMDETNPMTMIKTGLIEITVPDDEECYLALRAVHKTFRNFSMNFQDIIAFPSTAMKRMLQTVVLAPGGLPMVTRILSREMKHINRYGIVPFIAEKHTLKRSDFLEERVNWLQKTITENRALVGEKDQAGLVDIMSRTLTEKETFVFYANRLVELPESSSVLDFAYSIGPEIGNHISAVFINRQEVTLDYIPKRFDQLSFETNPAGSPRVEWLECVNTLEAQIQIKTKLRELDRYEAIAEGRGALLKRARENGLCPSGRIE